MPANPGPGYWYSVQPSGHWSPVALGPLSGPLHVRRSKLPRWPLPSDTHTTPLLSMSAPRGPKPSAGIEPHDRALAAEYADRAPDRAIDRARHDRVEAAGHTLVLGRVDRLVGLDRGIPLAIAIGVEHDRRPALRLLGVARFVEHFDIQPANDRPAAAGPQCLVLVEPELQMMGIEA